MNRKLLLKEIKFIWNFLNKKGLIRILLILFENQEKINLKFRFEKDEVLRKTFPYIKSIKKK